MAAIERFSDYAPGIASELLDIADELSSSHYSCWRKIEVQKGKTQSHAYWIDDPLQPSMGLVSKVERSGNGRYEGVRAARFILFDEEQGPHSTLVTRGLEDIPIYSEYDLDFLEAFRAYLDKEGAASWKKGLDRNDRERVIKLLRSANYVYSILGRATDI